MSSALTNREDFINSIFIDFESTIGNEIENNPYNRCFFSLFYKVIDKLHEDVTVFKREFSFADMNGIVDESIKKISITSNKLYLMPSVVHFYKSWLKGEDKMILFNLIQKMIAIGININGICCYKNCPFSPEKKVSTLDLIIADENPSLFLINMLVVNGGLCYSKKTEDNEIKLKKALDHLFNKVKFSFIGRIDRHSIFNAIPKETFSEIASRHIWVEANTFVI